MIYFSVLFQASQGWVTRMSQGGTEPLGSPGVLFLSYDFNQIQRDFRGFD